MTDGQKRSRRRHNQVKAWWYARAGARPCPLCGGAADPAGASAMHAHLSCRRCGLVYVADPPSAEDLRAAYRRVHESDYQVSHKRDWGPWMEHKHATMDRLDLSLPGPADYGPPVALDLGCGEGAMMKVLAERGWDPVGLELNPVMVAEARRQGLVVFEGAAEDPELPAGLPLPLHLVVMNHIIEHLRDPLATLKRVARWLRPRGLLLLETPQNPDFENIDHLNYLGAAAMELALDRAGFEAARWYDYVDDNYKHHNLACLARLVVDN